MLPSPPAETPEFGTMKRRRDTLDATDSSFHIHEIGQTVEVYFEPITTILRAHLPLSWLSSAQQGLSPGAIVEGHIKNVSKWEYHVLFARQLPNGGLYVFEKADNDVYTIYPLQPFVDVSWIQQATVGAAPSLSLQTLLHYIPGAQTVLKSGQHSRTSSCTSEASLHLQRNRRGAAARNSILSLPKTITIAHSAAVVNSQTLTDSEKAQQESAESSAFDQQKVSKDDAVKHEVNEVLDISIEAGNGVIQEPDHLSPDYLRQRYLETLYTTKTSLAYYAKGPLSRARARARAPNSSMNSAELATFYRDSLLPLKKLDTKYRESLKNIVTALPVEHTCSTKITKTSKSGKLGKDGLWPVERQYVANWWRGRLSQNCTSNPGRTCEMDAAIVMQQMRETQMQIVLILETLSIEARKQKSPRLPQDPEIKVESIEGGPCLESERKKPRVRDLQSDLNLLADKLCIWHSIGLETSADVTAGAGTKSDNQIEARDCLRNFCMDVITPFYSSKLPIICKALCKTLAGSELAEQAGKSRVTAEITKPLPGASVIRRVSSGRSQTLERVLSEEGLRQYLPPTLHRSATLPTSSRESSQIPPPAPNRNQSIQRSASFANRELDLMADAKVTASKKRKLDLIAVQKQELENAIQALKKPDRRMAGRTYMEEIDQRLRATKPVQVHSTPRHDRNRLIEAEGDGLELPPIPKPLRWVVSSTKKPRGLDLSNGARPSATKQAVLTAIQNTPSKQKSSADSATPNEELPQPIFATPVKIKPVNASIEAIFSTPRKHPKKPENSFEIPTQAGQAMRRAMTATRDINSGSIYDVLGWNDDYDV